MNKESHNSRFEAKIRHKLRLGSVSPPPDAWENISRQLDLEEVWQGIDARLQHAERFVFRKKARYVAAAAAVGIVLMLLPWPISKKQYQEPVPRASYTAVNDNSNNDKLKKKDNNPEKKTTPQYSANKNERAYHQDTTEMNSLKPKREDLTSEEKNEILKPVTGYLARNKADEQPVSELEMKEKRKINPLSSRIDNPFKGAGSDGGNFMANRLYLGLNGMLSNTWLLNNKTFAGFRPEKLVATQMNYEHSFSAVSGLRLGPALTVEGELSYRQNIGQTYYEYLNGNYVKREINLKYMHSAAMARFNRNDKPLAGINAQTVLVGGLYYNHLQSAHEQLEHETNNIKAQYKNSDFGLILGVDEQLLLSRRINLSAGIRANYGLWNVFEGDGYIPAYLNNTNIASFNFVLGIQFYPFK